MAGAVTLFSAREGRSGYLEYLAISAAVGGAALAAVGGVILLKQRGKSSK